MSSGLPLAALAATSALALAAASGFSASLAQPAAPAASFALPHAFAGYSQPDITQCTTTGDAKRECIVPAMTAGRYVIVAQDGATSTGADATQALQIALNGEPCATIRTSQPFTGKAALPPLVCQVTFLTDAPITVTATFAVEHATPAPGGPRLVFRRSQWNGVISATAGELAPRTAPAKAK